jgi:HPt (histidine-containing phosphotransfer) domain-containing protein
MSEERNPARVTTERGFDCEIIRVPNELTAKAGDFRIDATLLAVIDSELETLGDGYPEMARDDVAELAALWRLVKADPLVEANVLQLHRIAHNIKGNSGTYGYTLLSRIAGSLCQMIEGGAVPLEGAHPAIGAHIDAIQAVLSQRVRGDGGAIGRKLIDGLSAAVRKCRTASRGNCVATCGTCRRQHSAATVSAGGSCQ